MSLRKGISNWFPHHREAYSLVLLNDIEINKQKVTNNLTNKSKNKQKVNAYCHQAAWEWTNKNQLNRLLEYRNCLDSIHGKPWSRFLQVDEIFTDGRKN